MVAAPKMWRKQEEIEDVIEDEAEAEETAEVDEKEAKTEAADVLKIKFTQLTPLLSLSLPPSPRCPNSFTPIPPPVSVPTCDNQGS